MKFYLFEAENEKFVIFASHPAEALRIAQYNFDQFKICYELKKENRYKWFTK